MRTLIEEPNATHCVEDLVSALQETSDSLADETTDRTYLKSSLYHTHLPKLDDADVVEYDPSNGTVQYRGDPYVEQWVEQMDRIEE